MCFKWPILNIQALHNAGTMPKSQNKAHGPNYKVFKRAHSLPLLPCTTHLTSSRLNKKIKKLKIK